MLYCKICDTKDELSYREIYLVSITYGYFNTKKNRYVYNTLIIKKSDVIKCIEEIKRKDVLDFHIVYKEKIEKELYLYCSNCGNRYIRGTWDIIKGGSYDGFDNLIIKLDEER